MPLSSGMIEVCGPTAGANDLIASSRSNALQLNNTTSNFLLRLSACTAGGFSSGTSPLGLLITRPPPAKNPADGAGADHENTHCSAPSCCSYSPLYHCSPNGRISSSNVQA